MIYLRLLVQLCLKDVGQYITGRQKATLILLQLSSKEKIKLHSSHAENLNAELST